MDILFIVIINLLIVYGSFQIGCISGFNTALKYNSGDTSLSLYKILWLLSKGFSTLNTFVSILLISIKGIFLVYVFIISLFSSTVAICTGVETILPSFSNSSIRLILS